MNRCKTCKWYQSYPEFEWEMTNDGTCRLFPRGWSVKKEHYCGQHGFGSFWRWLWRRK